MEPQASTPHVSSRPSISIDGEPDGLLSGAVLRLDVVHRLGEPARLEIEIIMVRTDGGETTIGLPPKVKLGANIIVTVHDESIFTGEITAIERRFLQGRPPSALIVAQDALQRFRYAQRRRSYMDLALRDLVSELAARHGLQTEIDSAAASLVRPWTQLYQTDLELLVQLAAHAGASTWVEGGRLRFEDPRTAEDTPSALRLFQDLREVAVRTDLDEQTNAVRASGWAPLIPDTMNARIAYNSGDLHDCPSGAEALSVMGHDAPRRAPDIAYSPEHAQLLARSVYERPAYRYVRAHGLAQGAPWLRVGRWVALEGLGDEVDASFYVRAIHHRFSAQTGFQTELYGERPCTGNEEVKRDVGDHQRDRGGERSGTTAGGSRRGTRFNAFERLRALLRRRRQRFR